MYAAIVGTPSGTTFTISGGSDYIFGTTAITIPQYSKVVSPNGYPQVFNYSPANQTWDSTVPTSPTTTAKFSVLGRMCFVQIKITYGTAGATNTQFNCDGPFGASGAAGKYNNVISGALSASDDTTFPSVAAQGMVYGTSPTFYVKINSSNVNAKTVWINGSYQI
jgi:hypothetical protein